MATEILVTPEELRIKANEIKKLRSQHITAMKKIKNLVYSLSAVWKGDAQTEFLQNFASKAPVFDDFERVLLEFANLVETHANNMEELDSDLASKFSKL